MARQQESAVRLHGAPHRSRKARQRSQLGHRPMTVCDHYRFARLDPLYQSTEVVFSSGYIGCFHIANIAIYRPGQTSVLDIHFGRVLPRTVKCARPPIPPAAGHEVRSSARR